MVPLYIPLICFKNIFPQVCNLHSNDNKLLLRESKFNHSRGDRSFFSSCTGIVEYVQGMLPLEIKTAKSISSFK